MDDNIRIGKVILMSRSQSNELTRGPPEVSSALLFIGGVHIGTRALHVLNLIWFVCIARLSQCGGGG
jgi:hypothetical protein